MDPTEVARRSVARISFKWKNTESLNEKTADDEVDMVITGVILSVRCEECLISIDPSFFRGQRRFSFSVNLPEHEGKYGKTITVTSRQLTMHEEFCLFAVKANNYIASVEFETSPIAQHDLVFASLFPREGAISTAHGAGRVVAMSQSQNDMQVLFHDCAMHEYGHLGSPIFNHKGRAVGICYATQYRTHAWTVSTLRQRFSEVLIDWSVKYAYSNNDPRQEGGSSSREHASQEGSRAEGPGSSAPLHRVTALPLGVVTLAYNRNASPTMTYLPGIIIMCERGQDNDHTTFVLSSHKALYDKIYVCFGPNKRVEAELLSSKFRLMILRIKDKEYHEPVTWSSRLRPHPGHELVESISVMAGTKLNAKAIAPMKPLVGTLALYGGQITTPRCNAATTSSCTIVDGTENYFQLSCSFLEDFVTFRNVDLDKTSYECDSVVSAPVFNLKGEFVGIIYSSGNWPDQKTGIYCDWLLSIIEQIMMLSHIEWSKDKLKWGST